MSYQKDAGCTNEQLNYLINRVRMLTEALEKISKRHEFSQHFQNGCICEGHELARKTLMDK